MPGRFLPLVLPDGIWPVNEPRDRLCEANSAKPSAASSYCRDPSRQSAPQAASSLCVLRAPTGVMPCRRRKAWMKCETLEKPISKPMSVTERSVVSSKNLARSSLRLRNHVAGDAPVAVRKRRLNVDSE